MPTRINVGCGASPTEGWLNYDNSLAIRLPKARALKRFLVWMGVVGEDQLKFSDFAAEKGIHPADARHLPVPSRSVDVLYTSHMLEHLDRIGAEEFLQEATRVLVPGGHIRIVVPDLRRLVDNYLADGDATGFLERSLLTTPAPKGIRGKLRSVVVGPRHHAWMYDDRSLCGLLRGAGFEEVVSLAAGSTNIPEPGLLDLRERELDSLYVEARRPL